MVNEFASSLAEGERGGVPNKGTASAQNHDDHGRRSHPGDPGNVKIGRGVLQVELPRETVANIKETAAAIAMNACKKAFEHWKETHPQAERTPIRYSQCSKDALSHGGVQDHRAPASEGHQR